MQVNAITLFVGCFLDSARRSPVKVAVHVLACAFLIVMSVLGIYELVTLSSAFSGPRG